MNDRYEEFFNGIGLSIGVVITGIVLPILFTNRLIMTLAIFLVVLGIMGLGVELEKVYINKGYTNIFMGIGFLLLGISILILFYNIFTKIFFLCIFLIGLYATISGSLKLYHSNINTSNPSGEDDDINSDIKVSRLRLILTFIVALSGFVANIVTIISFLNT